MDALSGYQLLLLVGAAAVGGAIFGIAGFAFGIIASLFLHHGFAAGDVVFIVVAGALVLNLGLLPKFWADIDLRRSAPYLVGATLGLPIGLALLHWTDPRLIRIFVAVLVLGYCLFALRQQSREPLRWSARRGHAADGAIGWAGGVVGGISGLGPMLPGIWYGLRGMSKVEQRALTQPYGIYVQGLMVIWLLSTGVVSRTAIEGVAVATPVMLVTALLGLRLFDGLSTRRFQRIVVAAAFVGAGFLLASQFRGVA
jgi:uncharacterized membrane protein YfcA